MAVKLKEGFRSPCPACGADNRLGAVICGQCGRRILLGVTEPPRILVRAIGGPRAAIRNLLISMLVVGVVCSLLLIFWPCAPVGSDGLKGRDAELVTLLEHYQREIDANAPLTPIIVNERVFNRYVGERLDPNRRLSVDIDAGRMVMIANEPIGPLTLSTRVVLGWDEKTREVAVTGAWIGHFPVPPSRGPGMIRRLSRRFGLDFPESLWDQMRVRRLDSERITLAPPQTEAS
jgi:hypothetical protein